MARLRVFQAQNAIFTKRKADVDRGLQTLMEIYNDDKNYVPALLAMSQVRCWRKTRALPKHSSPLWRSSSSVGGAAVVSDTPFSRA